MSARTFILIIFTMLLISSHLTAGTIRGTVTDGATGDPLAGANIRIEGGVIGVFADPDGHYILANVPVGVYQISASYIGYVVHKTEVRITSGEDQITRDFGLEATVLPGQNVIITANRAEEGRSPVAFSNLNRQDLETAYWGQDVPMLLAETPNLFSYSESGNGIGYSHLQIRGFNQQRVNVMINNIPLNDPEEHVVYWVDMPDFGESIEDIQVQRGAGNAMYGLSGVGGSVNIQTDHLSGDQGLSLTAGYGDFNTRKYSVNFRSGLIDNTYSVYGRYSKVLSDGYRDRSDLDAWAYFIGAARFDRNMTTKINVYSGPFTLNAAWYAASEEELEVNHQANPSHFHPDVPTTDNFNQPHYEFHHEWCVSPQVTMNNTLFYIHGRGYYEYFDAGQDLVEHGYDYYTVGVDSVVTRFNIVRQKWVDKDQYGWISRVDLSHAGNKGRLSIGGEFNTFGSDHWGMVDWASNLPPNADPHLKYYDYDGAKWWATAFVHENYAVNPRLRFLGELQLQYKNRTMEQKPAGNFAGAELNYYEVDYTFFNPKLGLNFNPTEQFNLYGNFSIGNREPTDADLFDTWQGADDFGIDPLFAESDTIFHPDGSVKYVAWDDPLTEPETVYNYELGVGYATERLNFKTNFYFMDFRNEIVPLGRVREDGTPIRGNAGQTVHQGVEFSLRADPGYNLILSGSLSLSQNEYQDFTQHNWDGTTTALDGNPIALFPSIIGQARITHKLPLKGLDLTTSLQFQHVGQQYLDNTHNEDRTIDPYSVVNAVWSMELKALPFFRGVTLKLWLNNLFDEEYETSGYFDEWATYDGLSGNFYFPAAGRNVYFSTTVSF